MKSLKAWNKHVIVPNMIVVLEPRRRDFPEVILSSKKID